MNQELSTFSPFFLQQHEAIEKIIASNPPSKLSLPNFNGNAKIHKDEVIALLSAAKNQTVNLSLHLMLTEKIHFTIKEIVLIDDINLPFSYSIPSLMRNIIEIWITRKYFAATIDYSIYFLLKSTISASMRDSLALELSGTDSFSIARKERLNKYSQRLPAYLNQSNISIPEISQIDSFSELIARVDKRFHTVYTTFSKFIHPTNMNGHRQFQTDRSDYNEIRNIVYEFVPAIQNENYKDLVVIIDKQG